MPSAERVGAFVRCPNGGSGPNYSCFFCFLRVHGGDSPCGCSTFRGATQRASICLPCAEALDQINDMATPIGRVAQALIRKADTAGRPTDD